MNHSLHKWLRIALLNLTIIAFIGVVLRYKIIFSLPFVDQKFLLDGHSHFAFAGWITQMLMTLLVAYLYNKGQANAFKRYFWLLTANLITAYGMLITFPIQGYGLFSNSFSVLSFLVAYIFAVYYWKDLNRLKSTSTSHLWFKAAIVFNSLSSLGAYSLVFMMVNHITHQNWYLSAVYFYLHYQYNGWFFFACGGLLIHKLESLNILNPSFRTIFWLFFIAFIPAYFLSTLWMPLPVWVYVSVLVSAATQLVAWYMLLKIVFQNLNIFNTSISLAAKCLLSLSALALTIKFLLQMGSTYPALGTLAFGFRPIVIGYLHLVLLGVITIFILGYIVSNKFVLMKTQSRIGIITFVFGIIFNEIVLMTQGLAGLKNVIVPYLNELLFIAAIIMFTGVLLFVICQFQNKPLVEK